MSTVQQLTVVRKRSRARTKSQVLGCLVAVPHSMPHSYCRYVSLTERHFQCNELEAVSQHCHPCPRGTVRLAHGCGRAAGTFTPQKFNPRAHCKVIADAILYLEIIGVQLFVDFC